MDDLHDRISRRAHGLWEKEGSPHGRDREFWERAESLEREAAAPPMQTPLQARTEADAEVDKAMADTFPASDPPAFAAPAAPVEAKKARAAAKSTAPAIRTEPPKKGRKK